MKNVKNRKNKIKAVSLNFYVKDDRERERARDGVP